jgi:hypothetical protein
MTGMPSPTLIDTDVEQASPLDASSRSESDPMCDACAHAASAHDAIGLRFCRATLVGAIPRGCICRP